MHSLRRSLRKGWAESSWHGGSFISPYCLRVCCDIWEALPLTIGPPRRTFSAYPAPLNQDNEVLRVNVPGEHALSLARSIMIEAVKCNEDQFLCLAGKKTIKKPAITSLLTTEL